MIRTLGLAIIVSVAALPVFAQATEEQKSALTAAIEANGCTVTADNNAAILEAAGLTEADAAAVVQALIDGGTASINGGNLVLSTGACQ